MSSTDFQTEWSNLQNFVTQAAPSINPLSTIQDVGGKAVSAGETAVSKSLGIPPFDAIVTILAGIILVVLGVIFVAESNKTIQQVTKAVTT